MALQEARVDGVSRVYGEVVVAEPVYLREGRGGGVFLLVSLALLLKARGHRWVC